MVKSFVQLVDYFSGCFSCWKSKPLRPSSGCLFHSSMFLLGVVHGLIGSYWWGNCVLFVEAPLPSRSLSTVSKFSCRKFFFAVVNVLRFAEWMMCPFGWVFCLVSGFLGSAMTFLGPKWSWKGSLSWEFVFQPTATWLLPMFCHSCVSLTAPMFLWYWENVNCFLMAIRLGLFAFVHSHKNCVFLLGCNHQRVGHSILGSSEGLCFDLFCSHVVFVLCILKLYQPFAGLLNKFYLPFKKKNQTWSGS